jgi:hypothetical protein
VDGLREVCGRGAIGPHAYYLSMGTEDTYIQKGDYF